MQAMSASPFWPQTLVDLAQILSAIATAAAVIVSLHLARRRPVPELRGHAGLYLVIHQGTPRPWPELISVSATNIGSVDAVVTGMGWKVHHWRKKKRGAAVQDTNLVAHGMSNPRPPVRLAQGEEITFRLPTSGPDSWMRHVVEERGFFTDLLTSRKDLDRLRAVVYTSVGPGLRIKPSKDLLDRIWEAQANHLAAARRDAAKKSQPQG